jgi:maltodextrin utilization protein YvdJ
MLKNSKRFSSLTYQKEKLPTTKQLSMALVGNRMKLIMVCLVCGVTLCFCWIFYGLDSFIE